jgi:hypothetical protein
VLLFHSFSRRTPGINARGSIESKIKMTARADGKTRGTEKGERRFMPVLKPKPAILENQVIPFTLVTFRSRALRLLGSIIRYGDVCICI